MRFLLFPLVLAIGFTQLSCSAAPRQAEPLHIERVERPAAPVGPPMIRRLALEDVLEKGPGRFFARMPVEPYRLGRRLVGHRILALYGNVNPHPEGLQVGDVVMAVNNMPISRPEQFMRVWQAVSTVSAIEVKILRGEQPMRITYRIVD